MPRKIYVVGGSYGYANWMQGQIVKHLEDADLVVFTGGEDVDPIVYGEPKHPKTYSNRSRDKFEVGMFIEAQKLGKHIIGICRGAQLSCAMSGGKLVQHQENPEYIHPIIVGGERWSVPITSTHHQAMYPYDLPENEYKLLAYTHGISSIHQDGNQQEMLKGIQPEAEICYFPKTKALGIQGHPEAMNEKRYPETIEYLREILDAHLNDKL